MPTLLFNNRSIIRFALGILIAASVTAGSAIHANGQNSKKLIRKIDITRDSQQVSKIVVGSITKGSKPNKSKMKPKMAKPKAIMANKMPQETPPGVSNFVVGSISRKSNLLNYCLNISDAATEARSSMLLRMLKERETEMESVIRRLEERTMALANWMEKRERFLARANDSLISIFESMRPDAAAQQLTAMDTGLAAAIIMKLKPKISSAIMTEMKAKNAAQIASLMTSAINQETMVKNQ